MPIVSLDNTITIAISARDRHASARWYLDKLGFELLCHADDAGWSELQTKTAGVTLGLGEQTEPTPRKRRSGAWCPRCCHRKEKP